MLFGSLLFISKENRWNFVGLGEQKVQPSLSKIQRDTK